MGRRWLGSEPPGAGAYARGSATEHGAYLPPLDKLLTLGDPRNAGVTERRQALGLTQEHLTDLLRMARDRGLYTADSDTDEVWAPLHAFNALEKIAEQHPELLERVMAVLSEILDDAEHHDEVVVTAAMGGLVELGAVEALPLIRRAFELGRIDEMVYGPWGDVLDDLGVEPEEGDPLLAESRRRFEERQERLMPREQREQLMEALERFRERTALRSPEPPARALQSAPPDPRRTAQEKARKHKHKRKIESASRKANRRKRK